MALGGRLVVNGTQREGEAVMHPRVPFDPRIRADGCEVRLEAVDHLRGGVVVELGAGEVELTRHLLGQVSW